MDNPSNDYFTLEGGIDSDEALDFFDIYVYAEPTLPSERCDDLAGKKCLPMSQCNLQNLSDSDEPPLSCGFSDHTGEDNFCCVEKNLTVEDISIPQPPLFNQTGKAWPCEDHTEMCKKWKKGCKPDHESYEFMKFACMETCEICKNDVRYAEISNLMPIEN